ncbi:MAG: FprA family A-type flavoprotein [Bacteroidia bacterium]|jgi:flavorubredoxin|nr:FprA family A-type flavoprotein [Bacteroidia bacterium]
MKKIIVSNRIHYIGVNDRRKALFENNWPLPQGVAYNSYLISDEKSILIDTLEFGSKDDYIDEIEVILQGKPLDFLVVNHMEPDHSSMIGLLLRVFPSMKIIGNNKTYKILEAYYKLKPEQFFEVSDGQELDLGYHKLKFVMTPWVHWPETMMTYDMTDKVLFSCDAFGSFGTLDGGVFDDEIDFETRYEGEMLRYYSNIVGKYSNMVQKALAKLDGVPVKFVCPSHGPVWRKDPMKVISLYDKWSKYESEPGVVIVFASMYGNTEKMADYIARLIAEKGERNIIIHDVSKTHVSYILRDIWKYNSLILGSCAYNAGMHPMMAQLCHELEVAAPKNKRYSLFGSYSWSGGGLKMLESFSSKMSWQLAEKPVEVLGIPDCDKMDGFISIAEKLI